MRDDRRGEPFGLSPAVQLTVYRVLQEALSNARRHAPGRAIEVVTDYQQAALVLTVTNRLPVAAIGAGGRAGRSAGREVDVREGPDPSVSGAVSGRSTGAATVVQATPGHGLIGMTERATLVGGTLSAGPVPGDGWRVRLTVPRPAAAETAAPIPTIPERSATSTDEPGSAVGQEAP